MLNDIQIPPDQFIACDVLRGLVQSFASVGAAHAARYVKKFDGYCHRRMLT